MGRPTLPFDIVEAKLRSKGFRLAEPYKAAGKVHKIYCLKHNETHSTNLANVLYIEGAGIWCCRQAFFTGPNSPHYNKNLTQEQRNESRNRKDYARWKRLRKAIFERDNYECQCCLKVGGQLNAHHLFNWANNEEQRWDPNNLVSLCTECHKGFHSEKGYKNTTPLEYVLFRNNKGIVVNEVAEDLLKRIDCYEELQKLGK